MNRRLRRKHAVKPRRVALTAAGSYFLAASVLTLTAYLPDADSPAAATALWWMLTPASQLAAFFYLLAGSAVQIVVGDWVWLFNICWWISLAAIQATLVAFILEWATRGLSLHHQKRSL